MDFLRKIFNILFFCVVLNACNSNNSKTSENSSESNSLRNKNRGKNGHNETKRLNEETSNALNAKPTLPTKIQDTKDIAQAPSSAAFSLASSGGNIYEYLSGATGREDYFSNNGSIIDLTKKIHDLYLKNTNRGVAEKKFICESASKILQLSGTAKSDFLLAYEVLSSTYNKFEIAAESAQKDSCSPTSL